MCLEFSLKMLLHWPYMSRHDLTLAPENSCAGSLQPTTGETAWAKAYQEHSVTLVPEASFRAQPFMLKVKQQGAGADLGTQSEEAGPQGELRGELAPQAPQRPTKPLLCIAA